VHQELLFLVRGTGLSAAVSFLVVIAALDLRGQTPAPQTSTPPAVSSATPQQNAAELTSRDAPATFSAKVNLVMVPVIVRDSKGKAIGDLKKEDFQLFDKGKPQVITRFSMEKAGESVAPVVVADDVADEALENAAGKSTPKPAGPIAQRFVAYMFDDVHTTNPDLIQARDAADRHLAESWDPTTRAALLTTSGVGNVDFTDDRLKLHEALMKLMARPTLGPRGSQCPDLSYYMADLIFNKNDQNALRAAAVEAQAGCSPPPPVSSGPGAAAAAAQALQAAENLAQAMAGQVINEGERETRLAFTTLENAIRRLSAAPGERTLIFVSGGFYFADDLRWEESDIFDRAIRANVRISTLNARGLYVMIPGGDASSNTPFISPAVSSLKNQYDRESAIAEEGILEELADNTGGRYFHNNNDLKGGFDQIAAPPEFHYVLGFSPQNLRLDGSYHALKVKLVNARGLDVQARRGYYAPKHLDDPEEEAKREIHEAMFSRDELQDIPIDLHLQFFKTGDASAKIAVLARVSIKNLRFQKTNGRNNDDLKVFSGLFDRNGNFIGGLEKTVQMHLQDATLEKLLNSGITVRSNFDVVPGSYVVRLVVRDSEGQTMAARNGVVEIP
jgi:VWFA-related protein